MNVQQHYDLEICRDYEEEQIKKEVKPITPNSQNKLFHSLSDSRKIANQLRKHL